MICASLLAEATFTYRTAHTELLLLVQKWKLNEWQLLTNAPDLTNDRNVVVS